MLQPVFGGELGGLPAAGPAVGLVTIRREPSGPLADNEIMSHLTQLAQSFRRLVTRPTDELTRTQQSVRFAVDLVRYCARQLAVNRAPQMAAALTYRTLFSLVPVVVLGLLVFRSFIGLESAQEWCQQGAYKFLGWSAVALPPEVDKQPASPTEQGDVPSAAVEREGTLRASADERLNMLVNNAWDLNVGSIGVVGLPLLIWAALALVITVEQSFNTIYNCPSGRPWHHRIAIYWSVLTLGPVLLFISLYLAGNVVDWVRESLGLATLVEWVSGLSALGASWLLFSLIYLLMPNGSVHLRPALIGSFIAAALWETGKWGFTLYVVSAVGYSSLYGSLGLIPLFLLWLYLTWLIVLFGLQVSYTLQALKGRKFEIEAEHKRQELSNDPHRIISMMTLIARSFLKGDPMGSEELARQLLMTPRSVAHMAELMRREGLLYHVPATRGHDGGYSLAVPPQQISVVKLLDLGKMKTDDYAGRRQSPASSMLDTLHDAQCRAAGEATLASLIALGKQ